MTSNTVQLFESGSIPTDPEQLSTALTKGAQSIPSSDGLPFMRLLRHGVYVYGAENIDVEDGSLWAVNPYAMQHGAANWGDGELLDERMVPLHKDPPVIAELPDTGYEWQPQYSMILKCVSGSDSGQTVMYKGTSKGFRNEFRKLLDKLVAQNDTDPSKIVPLVTLDIDSYHHKKYGEVFTPSWTVHTYVAVDESDVEALAANIVAGGVADTPNNASASRSKGGKKKTRRRQ